MQISALVVRVALLRIPVVHVADSTRPSPSHVRTTRAVVRPISAAACTAGDLDPPLDCARPSLTVHLLFLG
jgi:hypothetical protein